MMELNILSYSIAINIIVLMKKEKIKFIYKIIVHNRILIQTMIKKNIVWK